MNGTRQQYQYEGMKWLVELELLNHPQVINTLKLNIFAASTSIKEAELLIYRENKAMLVLLELTWFGRRFAKRRIFEEVQDSLSQLLPSFRFRITDDPKIMELAVDRVRKALTGGKYENVSSTSDNVNQQSIVQNVVTSSEAETTTRTSKSDQPDQKEQSSNPDAILPYVGGSDTEES